MVLFVMIWTYRMCQSPIPPVMMCEFTTNVCQKTLNVMSHNCHGLNKSLKKIYLRSLLSRRDVLFIQEHWLSEEQLSSLNDLG